MSPNVPFDICLILDNDVRTDGRVLKEAGSLTRAGWRVVIIGIDRMKSPLPDDEVIDGFRVQVVKPGGIPGLEGKVGKAVRVFQGYWLVARRLRQMKVRVYHANDFIGLLMLALAGLWDRTFIYDAHELYFERSVKGGRTPTRFMLSLLRPLEGWMARRAAGTITVGDQLANWLAEHLRIKRPVVVRNVVDVRNDGEPVPMPRQAGERIIGHSGYITHGRHLPELVEALRYLPEHVSLALVGDGSLWPVLERQAEKLGVGHRLRRVHPVTPQTMAPTMAQADAAVVIITSDATSYHFALPNKLFESIAAGLPLVVTDIPEVAGLVRQYDLGVILSSVEPEALARAIEAVLEPEANARYRANALRAREALTWEAEEAKLVALYRQVLGAE
ncbi:MAG TPA: glycosyltransferase [Aggregatilineales bacterium]|nr:glycosyltransferase [Aggregatilineales bacterium]